MFVFVPVFAVFELKVLGRKKVKSFVFVFAIFELKVVGRKLLCLCLCHSPCKLILTARPVAPFYKWQTNNNKSDKNIYLINVDKTIKFGTNYIIVREFELK